jgi:hypothetical protein
MTALTMAMMPQKAMTLTMLRPRTRPRGADLAGFTYGAIVIEPWCDGLGGKKA